MLKRLFDIITSFFLIIFLSPVFFLLSLFIYIFYGKPIIFKQKRLGKDCQEFVIYKFRTMTNDDTNYEITDEKRITKLGRILRKTSIDEIPVLFNVVEGSMSLVGPRPLLVRYKDRYNDFQIRRHEVRPGITGLAQVKGRNKLTWEEKFEYDVYYVENHNFWLDLKILFLTIIQVFSAKGISPDKQEIMPEFMGSSRKK